MIKLEETLVEDYGQFLKEKPLYDLNSPKLFNKNYSVTGG